MPDILRIAVAGACSRSGKTAAAVSVLQALPHGTAAAVKFTTTEDVFERCPRGSPCIVCDIDVPYRIVQDERTLREPGTDTDRLAATGARPVVWAIAKQAAVASAWRTVDGLVRGVRACVIEGSTVVEMAAPDLLIFVVHPFLAPARWKPTTPALLRRADLVVVNRPAAEAREPAAAVLDALALHRAIREVRVADVTRPLAEWAPELSGPWKLASEGS
jgi:hypothetical protein